MGIIYAILIFGFIVFFHELGHYSVARWNKIRVNEFWIGMGPTLIHRQIGETDWCLKLLPLGGACLMGEDDQDDQSEGSFNSKSAWRRLSVIAAGPVFNFILAFLASIVITAIVGVDLPIIGTVGEGTPAATAGLEAGDHILKINDERIHIFRDVSVYNQFHQGKEVELVYERNGKKKTVTIMPEFNEKYGAYMLGIGASGYKKQNPLKTIVYSAYEVKYWIKITMQGLGQLVTGKIGLDQLAGPVGVVSTVDSTYKASKSSGALPVFLNLLSIGVLLSANLGVMNLLPLPALDGGRIVFLILEILRRKRVPPEKEGLVHTIGMALLMLLMVLVFFNDLKRLFF